MMKQRAMMFILLLCSILLGVTREAAADCTAINTTYAMPSTLTVPRDLPVNSTFGPVITTGALLSFTGCNNTSGGNMASGFGTDATVVVASGYRVYATGISGIGYRLAAKHNGVCSDYFHIFGSVSQYNGSSDQFYQCLVTGTGWTYSNVEYQLTFVKTADVTGSGTVASLAAAYAFHDFGGSSSGTGSGTRSRSNFTLTGLSVKTTACSVSSSVINVALPTAKSTDFGFGDVGSNTGSTAFNIGLNNCDAGLNVNMILSAGNAGSSDKSLGLLTADSTSSGSGLALQLMYNNAPVTLDTAFSVLGSATTSGGNYQIPLAVRYYKTAASIKSGTINSSATFTMIYN